MMDLQVRGREKGSGWKKKIERVNFPFFENAFCEVNCMS